MTDAFPQRISYADAGVIITEVAARHRCAVDSLAVARADGRILARDLIAPIALPPFDNSAMDGFALRHADLAGQGDGLRLVGEQFAGGMPLPALGPGECVRITTGAALPPGADTVVAKEDAREAAGVVQMPATVQPGAFVRPRGGDVRAGERVAEAGCVLRPARIGLAAALGLAQIEVSARPTVAVFTLGDELVEPGMPLAAGQIHNSNRDLLMALLRAEGLAPTAWPALPDDPARLRTMLEDACAAFDVVITCGGVSAGEKDHVPGVLQALGQLHFWKLRMKPGMPASLASVDKAVVLALPGNPVSALATFVALGRPLLDAMQGRREPRLQLRAALQTDWDKTHARYEFLRGRLHAGEDGRLLVTPNPADASYQLRGAAESDVLIELGEGARRYAQGEVVPVIAY